MRSAGGGSPPHRGLSVYRAKAHADLRWWPMSTRVESSQATTLPQTPRQRAQFRTRLVALSCVVISPMEANRGAQDHSCRALVQQRVYVRSARRPAPTLQRCRNCWHTKGPKPPTRNQSLPCRRPRVPARRCSSPRRSNAAEARALPCAGALSEDVQPGDDYLVKMWLHLADVCGLISH